MYTLTDRYRTWEEIDETARIIIYDDKNFCVSLKYLSLEFNFQFTEETFLYDNIIQAFDELLKVHDFADLDYVLGYSDFLTEDQKNYYRLKYKIVDKIPDPKYKPIDLEDILYESNKLGRLRRNWLG